MNLEETKKEIFEALGSIYASVDALIEYLSTHKTSGVEIKINVKPTEIVTYEINITNCTGGKR